MTDLNTTRTSRHRHPDLHGIEQEKINLLTPPSCATRCPARSASSTRASWPAPR